MTLYVDEVRLWNKQLEDFEIEAEAAGALGSTEPAYIRFGCINCRLEEATDVCEKHDEFHLCDSIEIHTSGYQVARVMGWLNWNSRIWTPDAYDYTDDSNEELGIGICCRSIK
jgi:hypothetical protein